MPKRFKGGTVYRVAVPCIKLKFGEGVFTYGAARRAIKKIGMVDFWEGSAHPSPFQDEGLNNEIISSGREIRKMLGRLHLWFFGMETLELAKHWFPKDICEVMTEVNVHLMKIESQRVFHGNTQSIFQGGIIIESKLVSTLWE